MTNQNISSFTIFTFLPPFPPFPPFHLLKKVDPKIINSCPTINL